MNLQASDRSFEPPLKWAGGKRWLAPYFRELFEVHYKGRRWVEPFCGGLGLTLALHPQYALVSDINPHLTNFYRWVKCGLPPNPYQFCNDRDTYYRLRDEFNRLINENPTSYRAAWLFYYLNRTGYNGLCRFNGRGAFNVPFGNYARIQYRTGFADIKHIFRNWEFRCCSYEKLTEEIGDSDFLYADPPYDVEFTQYYKTGWTFERQVQLAEWLEKLPCPVVTSNMATERICSLYRKLGFDLVKIKAPRRISCTGDRTPAEEVLAHIRTVY